MSETNETNLDRRTRSLLNIAMLSALGDSQELALHVRAAITNGVTRDEIRETLLQAAIYCGVPAAMAAQRTVEGVLDEPSTRESHSGPPVTRC